MIRGIGVDTVNIDRFRSHLSATPALRERLFTEAERRLTIPSLAARFAAKEALIKALGGSDGVSWHDLEVERDDNRDPSFVGGSALATALRARGASRVHLSMTHEVTGGEGGIATAFVVLEGEEGADS